ncbi:hypothetical protein OHA37_24725 [Streptomyces sp. NBC_00335]|uniref:hypothetical protein n=1 Tax=unclassified Streptomyces TaxID=2593676 RepID=UPI002259DA43|nr:MULTISPECIES: hypothetical protein [unclassified Streptomyces]MCX5407059.1 hypothetical protein [Streptomyces sp. NBC_00086]
MIFRGRKLPGVVEQFEKAVRAQDAPVSERAFAKLLRVAGKAGDAEYREAGPRLAALLGEIPPGPRATVGVIVGACVERGADPVVCAPGILTGATEAFAVALEFCARWAETGGGELPGPEGEHTDEIAERVGHDLAVGWFSLPEWEMAAVAVLGTAAVRRTVEGKAELLARVERVTEASGDAFKCLTYALRVLDDEPLIVLHRESGTGFALRMSGIGDNFQLHTLLAGVLTGGNHVPGEAPSAREVAVCRDADGMVPTTGAFNLVGADGIWIFNEGTPTDIAVVDGVRLLVLDPSPYRRSWEAGRFFPGMHGDLVLERVLGAEETAGWFGKVAPDKGWARA